MITLINDDFRNAFVGMAPVRMIFADPPDNIDLKYRKYNDNMPVSRYCDFLRHVIWAATARSSVVWLSYNARHTFMVGNLVHSFLVAEPAWEAKACVQTFTFGQHNKNDLGNNHRPLVRLMKEGTQLYPDAVRVPSWRQLHGDKRANPNGRVPGDIFDFPRVTGNSKQRRKWHPTQLHEGLYERCIRLTCKPEDTVCDMFAGTGTMARVCARTKNPCILIELDTIYCTKIASEHDLFPTNENTWGSI